MWKNVVLLATKEDVLPPIIALMLGVLGMTAMGCFTSTTGVRSLACLAVSVIVFLFIASRLLRFAARYRRLKRGRCPRPGCRGVVQHSESLGKGWVTCPTCKGSWPELEGMKFRLTVRT